MTRGRPVTYDGMGFAGLPVTLAAARWVQRRPAGTLSSVTGRLRWRWLLTCLPVAFAAGVALSGRIASADAGVSAGQARTPACEPCATARETHGKESR